MELRDKSFEMPSEIKWHFIGHLQTNKVRKLLETRNLFVIETVDSEKLASAINKQLETNKTTPFNETLQLPLNIFVQVKTSDEESKSGVEPASCADLVKLIKEKMPNLKVCGLMTIGKLDGDPADDFACLRNTRSTVASTLEIPEEELELSMGMSGDFVQAVRPFWHSRPLFQVKFSQFGFETLTNPIICQDRARKHERSRWIFDLRCSRLQGPNCPYKRSVLFNFIGDTSFIPNIHLLHASSSSQHRIIPLSLS